MELTDIAPIEKWVEFEKKINSKSGLCANVFDIKGIRISDFQNWPNKLCPEIKATDKGQSFICAVAHMNLASMSKQTKSAVIEECDAGLVKIIYPIFVKDDFVGAVGACGLLLDGGEADTFLINKITEIEEEKLDSLSCNIPSISTKEAQNLVQFIKEEINKITSGI
jgi:ligand-binding sensor protein